VGFEGVAIRAFLASRWLWCLASVAGLRGCEQTGLCLLFARVHPILGEGADTGEFDSHANQQLQFEEGARAPRSVDELGRATYGVTLRRDAR